MVVEWIGGRICWRCFKPLPDDYVLPVDIDGQSISFCEECSKPHLYPKKEKEEQEPCAD